MVILPNVLAHVPIIPRGNESLATATVIPDPTKSWAIYGELHSGGEVQYYRFNIDRGQRIYVSMMKSTSSEDESFLPSLALFGTGLRSNGSIPQFVQKPENSNVIALEGKQPSQADYEGFSPGSFYSLGALDLNAPASGTYYIAVYDPARGGHYSLAVGERESFTLTEWILSPLNFITIYQWEGESLLWIFAPLAVTIAIGLLLIFWRSRSGRPTSEARRLVGTLAGLMFIGTGMIVLSQMTFALTHTPIATDVVITVVFATIPILLGIATIRVVSRSREKFGLRTRLTLIILGLLSLFAWAGIIIGPVLAIAAGLIPASKIASRSQST
jgi:hypothetical protein